MKAFILVLLFAAGAFFALRHFQPSFAQETFTAGGTAVAWGWVVVLGAAVLGYVVSKK